MSPPALTRARGRSPASGQQDGRARCPTKGMIRWLGCPPPGQRPGTPHPSAVSPRPAGPIHPARVRAPPGHRGPRSSGTPCAGTSASIQTSGSQPAPRRNLPAMRPPRRSPSAMAARYAPNAWRCHFGIGTSASTASGAAWSQPNARRCGANAELPSVHSGTGHAGACGGPGLEGEPGRARTPSMRAGACWMRLRRFLTLMASWSMSRAAGLPRPLFMLTRTPVHGPGLSRSWNGHRDRERPSPWPYRGGKAHLAMLARGHAGRGEPPGGLAYNWRGQRKSAAGSRVTVTWPRLCAVSTAWAEVRRNGVVPGVKVTTFTAHRPPR